MEMDWLYSERKIVAKIWIGPKRILGNRIPVFLRIAILIIWTIQEHNNVAITVTASEEGFRILRRFHF